MDVIKALGDGLLWHARGPARKSEDRVLVIRGRLDLQFLKHAHGAEGELYAWMLYSGDSSEQGMKWCFKHAWGVQLYVARF